MQVWRALLFAGMLLVPAFADARSIYSEYCTDKNDDETLTFTITIEKTTEDIGRR